LICDSTDRICDSLPFSAALSWVSIVCSWAMPPPFSSMDSAPSTSSTVALPVVRASGIIASLASRPWAMPAGGALSSMYHSPSRLDWRSAASALAGRCTSPLMTIVTVAVQLCAGRLMLDTRPTATSLTRTADCGTRSTTLLNCAVTVYG
jgi:hypothetical protein